jgi:hypothetical protein
MIWGALTLPLTESGDASFISTALNERISTSPAEGPHQPAPAIWG